MSSPSTSDAGDSKPVADDNITGSQQLEGVPAEETVTPQETTTIGNHNATIADDFLYLDPQDLILREEVYTLVEQLRLEFTQKLAELKAEYEAEIATLRAQVELLQQSTPRTPRTESTPSTPRIVLTDSVESTDADTHESSPTQNQSDPPEVRERSRSFLDKLKTAATGGKQKTKPQRPPRPSKDKKKSDSSSAQSSASSSVEQPKKRRTVWESIRKKIGLAGGSHSGSGSSSGSHSSEALRRTITGTSLSSGAETKPPSNTVVGLPIKSASSLELNRLFAPSSPRPSDDSSSTLRPEDLEKGEKIHTRWKSRLRTSIPATDQLGAEVDFSGCELAVVPSVLMQRVASILVLRLGNNHLTSWPPIESNNLVELDLSLNAISVVPAAIVQLPNLRCLSLFGNKLTSLPQELGKLSKLEFLDISKNMITELPASISGLTSLLELQAFGNKIAELPEGIGNLMQLEVLDLSENSLRTLPSTFSNLTNLIDLNLFLNKLTSLPDDIGNLKSLKMFNVSQNLLTDLPLSCGKWQNPSFVINITQNNFTDQLLRDAIQMGSQQVMLYLKERMNKVEIAGTKSITNESIRGVNNEPVRNSMPILDSEAAALLEEMLSDDSDVLRSTADLRASVMVSDFRRRAPQLEKLQRLKELVEDDEEEQSEVLQEEPEAPVVDPELEEKVIILASWASGVIQNDFKPLLEHVLDTINSVESDKELEYFSSVVHVMEKELKRVEIYLPPELHDTVLDSLVTQLVQNLEKRRLSRDITIKRVELENEKQTLRMSAKQLLDTFTHVFTIFESCPDAMTVLEFVNVVKDIKRNLPESPSNDTLDNSESSTHESTANAKQDDLESDTHESTDKATSDKSEPTEPQAENKTSTDDIKATENADEVAQKAKSDNVPSTEVAQTKTPNTEEDKSENSELETKEKVDNKKKKKKKKKQIEEETVEEQHENEAKSKADGVDHSNEKADETPSQR